MLTCVLERSLTKFRTASFIEERAREKKELTKSSLKISKDA